MSTLGCCGRPRAARCARTLTALARISALRYVVRVTRAPGGGDGELRTNLLLMEDADHADVLRGFAHATRLGHMALREECPDVCDVGTVVRAYESTGGADGKEALLRALQEAGWEAEACFIERPKLRERRLRLESSARGTGVEAEREEAI